MAVKNKVGGFVELGDETVIGVVLERVIHNDVRVRPTNVTASMATFPLGHVSSSLVTYTGTRTVTGSLSGFTISTTGNVRIFGTFDTGTIEVGDLIYIVTDLADNTAFFANVISVSSTELVFLLTGAFVTGAGVVPDNSTTTFSVEVAEGPTDVILLHNGPKGGFTQQFKGAEGQYLVNDVVQALITDA